MSVDKRTVVFIAVVSCAAVFVSGTLLVSAGAFLYFAGGAGSDTFIRGSYPPATTRYQGMTADQWNRSLLDADTDICFRAADALHHLGDEGTPFLLAGLIHFRQTGQREHLRICLDWLLSSRIDLPDLAIVVSILDDEDIQNRRTAVRLISAWGPKAKAYVPALASHLDDSNKPPSGLNRPDRDELLKRFHNELLRALHHIDPVAYPEMPPNLGPEQRPTSGAPGMR